MATFATEFIAVQKALGIEVKSMGNAAFREADEANATRIQKCEKDGCIAVFVDDKMVVCQFNGESVDADEAEMKQYFEI